MLAKVRAVTVAGSAIPKLPIGMTAAHELMLIAGSVRSENQAKPWQSNPGAGRYAKRLTAMTTVMKIGSCRKKGINSLNILDSCVVSCQTSTECSVKIQLYLQSCFSIGSNVPSCDSAYERRMSDNVRVLCLENA